ncbi:DUF2189 domain-containing protein [Octadecabacter sp. 1_MG-2023]|uniref:DUF2189 domain-containing protein n=1 Tax=unclassified Octadecabacter TaxID=196158 RepID=UPI001C08DD0C|nr:MULTISPECIES: DUF2189 domain-containing protein [unclassified Octadecabacter]MBU2993499.1 DUF2189 domain-containing protein [Octadecabacter sp. B2R22]MDO6733045.1 DUF2189 domain-containing protein [Octadecabacter sp. 1_MG-2023]
MTQDHAPAASPMPDIGVLTFTELWTCLKAGLFDFRAAPMFGLAFSAVYVFGGFVMLWLGAGHVTWVLATSLGFPLAAPFAAVGLYEVSRRLEADEPLDWREIFGVVWNERTRQVPWIGAIIVIYFLFWTFLSHMIFALFMGVSTLTNVMTSFDVFLTPTGLMMIGVELGVGAIVAFLLFSLTVVSLPLVLEKEIDFVSAMLLSLRCVRENIKVMLVWAFIIATLTFLAMIPWFLGLVIILPVLGHATWHIYRRALYHPVS